MAGECLIMYLQFILHQERSLEAVAVGSSSIFRGSILSTQLVQAYSERDFLIRV